MPPFYAKLVAASFEADDYTPLVSSRDEQSYVVVERTETQERRKRAIIYRTHRAGEGSILLSAMDEGSDTRVVCWGRDFGPGAGERRVVKNLKVARTEKDVVEVFISDSLLDSTYFWKGYELYWVPRGLPDFKFYEKIPEKGYWVPDDNDTDEVKAWKAAKIAEVESKSIIHGRDSAGDKFLRNFKRKYNRSDASSASGKTKKARDEKSVLSAEAPKPSAGDDSDKKEEGSLASASSALPSASSEGEVPPTQPYSEHVVIP